MYRTQRHPLLKLSGRNETTPVTRLLPPGEHNAFKMGHGLTVFSMTILGISVAIVFVSVYINQGGLWRPTEIPKLTEEWWGPGKEPAKVDESIKPFTIKIKDDVLVDLKKRLENTRYGSEPLEGVGFRYGFTSEALKKVVEFWKTKYNWRERETFLNKLPQFVTNIQGLDIHFIHIKPKNVPSTVPTVPLLMLHGWPGSVRELYDTIEILSKSSDKIAFEIIAPSLPGYGWSQGAVRPGLGLSQMGVMMRGLMRRLGHEKFYVHGGDWGSAIGGAMATLYPKDVLGFHTNMCVSNTPVTIIKWWMSSWWPAFIYRPAETYMRSPGSTFSFLLEESGYFHIQSTKPDTVGAALSDSPAGLAAYILEKFSTWTDSRNRRLNDGGLLSPDSSFNLIDLLDNVMIYWVTGSATTSMRLYAESFSRKQRDLQMDLLPVHVPTACARFRNELLHQPDALLRDRYFDLVRSTDFPDGGHFAAMQLPKIMAEDLRDAVADMESLRIK